MTKPSRRERWLLAVLPGALIVLVYGWFVAPGLREADREAQAALAKLSTQQGASHDMAHLHRDLKAQRDQLAQLNQQKRLLEARLQDLKADVADSDGGRLASTASLTALLKDHGLLTIAEGPQQSTAQELPVAVQRVSETSNRLPILWHLDVTGSFAQMRSALEAIAATPHGPVPLSLTMEPTISQTPTRRWTLVVWL